MPVERQVIESQLAAIGEIDRWWNAAEARVLPDILGSEERILAVVEGRLVEKIRRNRTWLIVVTTHRLVALRGGRVSLGRHQFEVPASEVGSVSHHTGMLRTTVRLATPDRKYKIRVQKRDASRFVTALSALMNRGGARRTTTPVTTALADEAEMERMYERIETLEEELTRMRDQIDFMENLLRRRIPDLPQLDDTSRPALPTGS